jgi:hypothetical protein
VARGISQGDGMIHDSDVAQACAVALALCEAHDTGQSWARLAETGLGNGAQGEST